MVQILNLRQHSPVLVPFIVIIIIGDMQARLYTIIVRNTYIETQTIFRL